MESSCILIAQLVFHLLPSPHFFLLVYILAFFSQVALVHEENGVGTGDLLCMFEGWIFGDGHMLLFHLLPLVVQQQPDTCLLQFTTSLFTLKLLYE